MVLVQGHLLHEPGTLEKALHQLIKIQHILNLQQETIPSALQLVIKRAVIH